ncbi:hypothetical protein [Deinococcus sp.]|uniref:hypothetical protein n=1 Tax=Deinococcus sp. TaxID=47478 RepID=UPI00391BA002
MKTVAFFPALASMTLLASCAPTASATSMKDLLGGVSTLYLQTKDTTGNIKFSAPVILAKPVQIEGSNVYFASYVNAGFQRLMTLKGKQIVYLEDGSKNSAGSTTSESFVCVASDQGGALFSGTLKSVATEKLDSVAASFIGVNREYAEAEALLKAELDQAPIAGSCEFQVNK